MATTNSLPIEHRRHAAHIPADILNRLSPAELRLRCAHAHEVDKRANRMAAEQCRHLTGHKLKLLRSMPAAEHVEETRRLKQLINDSPRQLQQDPVTGKLFSIAGAFENKLRDHKDSHTYPAGLLEAVDNRLNNRYVPDPKMAAVADDAIAANGSA